MPAGITETDGMMYVGKEPWHRLGVKLDNPATAAEAIILFIDPVNAPILPAAFLAPLSLTLMKKLGIRFLPSLFFYTIIILIL